MKKLIKKYLAKKNKLYALQVQKRLLLLNFFTQKVIGTNPNCNSSIHYTSRVIGYKNIMFPKNAESILRSMAVSGGCYISVPDGTTLEIGTDTLWAFNCCIQTANHGLINRGEYTHKSIKIGNNCWLGFGVTLLPGVQLGNNVTVGANSVVTKSFPDNCVIGGCPAKIIKYLQ